MKDIEKQLGLDQATDQAEAQMVAMIEKRILQMLDTDPNLLFSYLYRLDIREMFIKKAMNDPVLSPQTALANLVWNRQKERIETKKKYKQEPLDNEWSF